MAIVKANGVSFNVRVDGDERKPWLILSNSLGATLSMWDHQLDELTTEWRVLRYDTRGHGASEVPPGPYRFDDLVADVIGLMDAHRIDKAAFMGLSMGGMTGLGLALAHPERLRRVVCCDSRADAPEGWHKTWDDRVQFVRDNGMAALVPTTMQRWLTPATREKRPGCAKWLGEMIARTDPEGYIGCAMAIREIDYLKHLPGIKVPVLYVGGDSDSGAMPEVMQAMARATPGAAYHMIPCAAHIANIDNPAGFTAAIAAFLALRT